MSYKVQILLNQFIMNSKFYKLRVVVILIALSTSVVSANAQWFIEGGVSVLTRNSHYTGDFPKESSNLGISIAPQIGYWLNAGVAVGTGVSFSHTNNKSSELEVETITPGWGVRVFGRYKLLGMGKFAIFAESPVGIQGSISKEKRGTVTEQTQSSTNIYVRAYPLVSYNLSDKFSVMVRCDFLSVGYYYQISKNEKNDTKQISKNFDFSAQSTLFGTLANIGVYFSYNF